MKYFPIINIIVKYGIGFKKSPATGLVTAVFNIIVKQNSNEIRINVLEGGDSAMKAIITICTAAKEFTADQKQIMRRVSNVLMEHNLSVAISMKVKKVKHLKLKVS